MEEKRTRKTWDIEKVDPKWFVYTSETKKADIPEETLTHLRVDSSVREIPAKAFKSCTALVHVRLPETLSRIGKEAFDRCSSLKFIQFISRNDPREAFLMDPNLEAGTIVFPESTTLQVDDLAFAFCDSLRKVVVSSISMKLGRHLFRNCQGLLHVELPEGLQVIESGLFFSYKSLVSVNIPSSVTKILGNAFFGCSSLAAVDLPHGLLEMGASSFSHCVKLQTLCIRSTSSTVGQDAFEKGSGHQHTKWPLLKLIGQKAFWYCTRLIAVELPEGLQEIEKMSFRTCCSLTSVNIPSSVFKIGEEAFHECSSLASVVLQNGLAIIGRGSFLKCISLDTLDIPSTVSTIEREAFGRCSKLKHIKWLPLKLGKGAFSTALTVGQDCEQCSGQEHAKWPPLNIFDGAFSSCDGLISVDIPEGLQVIGSSSFYCTSLTSIIIPSSVFEIGAGAFWGCSKLASVILQNGLVKIGENSFRDCGSLETLHIPSTVSFIGKHAFYASVVPSRLKHVKLPPTLNRIEEDTFFGCCLLEYIEIPPTVSFIGKRAFHGCSSLSHVRVPPYLDNLYHWPWEGCNNVISIERPERTLIGSLERSFEAHVNCDSLVNLAIPMTEDPSTKDLGFSRLSNSSKLGRVVNDEADLRRKLKHRFDDSPLNKLCYYQSYLSSEDAMMQLHSLILEDPLAATLQVDGFGMTPLHVLSLSQIPNLDMLLVVMKGGHSDHIIRNRDSFGSTPMDYLCLNRMPNTTEVIRRVLQTRFDYLLNLDLSWKSDMLQAVDEALAVDISSRRRDIVAIYLKLATYERGEIILLVELCLWKMKIDEPISAKEQIVDRESCRIKSGALIVIPHVLPFLGSISGS